MTFEIFDKVMDKFLNDKCITEMWLNEVESCLGGAWDSIISHNYENNFVELLTLIMNDKDEWIYYFIYEKDCNWFSIEYNGKTIYINSLEKLYNLIIGGYDNV